MAMQAIPECIIGLQMPDDRFRIGERRLLAVIVFSRFLEIEKVHHLVFDQRAARGGFNRALIAAVFALDRTRYVKSTQFLDGVIQHAVAEKVVPGVGEKPECRRHMGPNGRTLRAWGTLPLA